MDWKFEKLLFMGKSTLFMDQFESPNQFSFSNQFKNSDMSGLIFQNQKSKSSWLNFTNQFRNLNQIKPDLHY